MKPMKPALDKIYVILDKQDKQDKQDLDRLTLALSDLFSHANLTSNLYLVTKSLTEGMSQVERVQKTAMKFLEDNIFARLYIHFIHSVSLETTKEIDFYFKYYYQGWKRLTRELDLEAYMHQEVPRLMLLPVIVPDNKVQALPLKGLFDVLKGVFLLPCLYLDEGTSFVAQDEELIAMAEKVYFGRGNSGELADIVCGLCYQDILEDSTARLESNTGLMTDPCPPALIVSAQDGMIYPCIDAFVKKVNPMDIYGTLNVDTLMDQYYEYCKSKRDCLACRQRAVEFFAGLPMPKAMTNEVGTVLYHFGTLLQDAKNHAQAIEYYNKSVDMIPIEEAGHTFFRLGLCYTTTGLYDQALEAFNKAERTYLDQYYFHFYTGLCFFEKGDYSKAVEKFSEALNMKPDQGDLVRILIYMGTCYNSLDEYKKAIEQMEEAKETAGHVKEIYNALGFSYFQLKDYDKAIENLSRAVEIDPYSAIDFASLGSSYREKGDVDKAIAMYEKALELDAGMAVAMDNLNRLKPNPDKPEPKKKKITTKARKYENTKN